MQEVGNNLAKLFSYLWKPNCLFPPQQTIICLFVHFSQKRRHTIICVLALNLLPEKFPASPQYRNGSNGFPRIEYGDSALLCGYFENGGPVIFTIGKVVHNGQLGLVWLIHWNWDHFYECHIFPTVATFSKTFLRYGGKIMFKTKFGRNFDKHNKSNVGKKFKYLPLSASPHNFWLKLDIWDCVLTFKYILSQNNFPAILFNHYLVFAWGKGLWRLVLHENLNRNSNYTKTKAKLYLNWKSG